MELCRRGGNLEVIQSNDDLSGFSGGVWFAEFFDKPAYFNNPLIEDFRATHGKESTLPLLQTMLLMCPLGRLDVNTICEVL